jgi:hypothetical protein
MALATFRPALRTARAIFRPVLRLARATFRPVLRVVRATFRLVLRAVRAVFRPVLRVARAAFRPDLRAVRAVLRAVLFVVAIVVLPSVSYRVNALLFADFAVAHGKSISFGNLSTLGGQAHRAKLPCTLPLKKPLSKRLLFCVYSLASTSHCPACTSSYGPQGGSGPMLVIDGAIHTVFIVN